MQENRQVLANITPMGRKDPETAKVGYEKPRFTDALLHTSDRRLGFAKTA